MVPLGSILEGSVVVLPFIPLMVKQAATHRKTPIKAFH